MTKKPLHIPHRSRHVPAEDWVDFPRAIHARWQALATRKGFRIDRRVRDRLHLALECAVCGAHSAHKLHTLRTAQPACLGCQADRRANDAKAAGFELLSREEGDRHYNLYRLPCGHETLLQASHVGSLAKQGPVPGYIGYHCSICYGRKLNAMAVDLGWRLVGPDPQGDANYRMLAHADCGHQQRVAIANLDTGRFACGSCSDGWASDPSVLYLMRFRVPGQGRFIKLGYSNNPRSRMRYQLRLRADVEAELIDEVQMPSGQKALQLEKTLHRQLASDHPEAVIPQDMLAGWINVTSEIYADTLEPVIRRIFDGLEGPKRRKVT